MAQAVQFFAAANTAHGFVSLFDRVFSVGDGGPEKLYILKGGPGTGKSSFMRRAAQLAEARGLSVDYVLCCSDPSSLDGIRIPQLRLAFADGTAPHVMEAHCPGAREELWNLGMFSDRSILEAHRAEIFALSEQYASAQKTANQFLAAAGRMRSVTKELVRPAFLSEKAHRAAGRLLSSCKREEHPQTDTIFLSSNSTKGLVHLPGAGLRAENCTVFRGRRHAVTGFLGTLCTEARNRGLSFVRFADPLCPAETEGLYVPAQDTVYLSSYGPLAGESAEVRGTDRFFAQKELPLQKLRFVKRCETALLAGASEAMRKQGELHDLLEGLYAQAMDFDAAADFRERMLADVL